MYNTRMISWLKKHFIPHEGNNHRPHFLHKESIRNVLILVIFLEVFTFLIPTLSQINRTGGMAAVLPAILSDLTNEERQTQNLQNLTVNPILNDAAEMKATDMATKGYFAHTSPEGKTPWYWLSQVGYKYQYAGENLAINFSDSKDVTNAWMASPTHKANIIKENYTEVGTGVATGMYEGKETIFVAQVYANPLPKTIEQIEPIKTEAKNNGIVSNLATINESSNVLGAETVTKTENTNTITPVKVETKIIDTTPNQIKPIQTSTFIQKAFASPRGTTNTIMSILFGIVVISLLLNIFIKIKHHHPDLITNGLITLVIIGAILVANYYLTHRDMVTTQSLDYSSEGK